MPSTTKYLTKAQFSAAKSRLTRALNGAKRTGDWQKVLDTVAATYAEWDAGSYAYPDDWHRWERAKDDALWGLRRMG